MKKLIVLAILGLFVAATAMAQDVTLTGEVETRWLNDFNNKTFEQSPEVVVGVNATVDDYNTLYIEIEEGFRTEFTGTSKATFPFDKAHHTIDLGGLFMLPVGVTVRTGFDEYDGFDAVKVTFGEWEDVIGNDFHSWGHEINIVVNEMIAIRTDWASDFGEKKFGAAVAVTYDPIYVEAGYRADGSPQEIGDGDIEAGIEFAMDVADGITVASAATVDYDLDVAGDSMWTAGAAAKVTYMDMVSLALAWRGEQDAEAGAMQINVTASPIDNLTAYLVAGLSLDDAASFAGTDTFDSFEGSLNWKFGAASWYGGVYWAAEGSGGVAREKSDFYTNTPDALGIFMRAELKY